MSEYFTVEPCYLKVKEKNHFINKKLPETELSSLEKDKGTFFRYLSCKKHTYGAETQDHQHLTMQFVCLLFELSREQNNTIAFNKKQIVKDIIVKSQMYYYV